MWRVTAWPVFYMKSCLQSSNWSHSISCLTRFTFFQASIWIRRSVLSHTLCNTLLSWYVNHKLPFFIKSILVFLSADTGLLNTPQPALSILFAALAALPVTHTRVLHPQTTIFLSACAALARYLPQGWPLGHQLSGEPSPSILSASHPSLGGKGVISSSSCTLYISYSFHSIAFRNVLDT